MLWLGYACNGKQTENASTQIESTDSIKTELKQKKIDMKNLNYDSLLEKNGAIALEKQYSFSELIGDRNWSIDIAEQKITFGDDIQMDMQLLGSYSYKLGTWLWVWANEQANYPQEVMQSALKLKALGEKYNIDNLIKPEYEIDPIDVHALGILASGELGASAYYAADYGDGIALVLINSPQLNKMEYNEEARMLRVFSQLIQTFSVNHKRAFIHYLEQKGYEYSEQGNQIIANKEDQVIEAKFDEQQRLITLNGNLINN